MWFYLDDSYIECLSNVISPRIDRPPPVFSRHIYCPFTARTPHIGDRRKWFIAHAQTRVAGGDRPRRVGVVPGDRVHRHGQCVPTKPCSCCLGGGLRALTSPHNPREARLCSSRGVKCSDPWWPGRKRWQSWQSVHSYHGIFWFINRIGPYTQRNDYIGCGRPSLIDIIHVSNGRR